jgi:CubicO group peptidase (beta-lactamase class C family)
MAHPDRHRAATAALLGFVLACSAGGVLARNARQERQPFEWPVVKPESQGMSSTRLDALKNDLETRKSKSLLIIRNDTIVYEWYAAGHAATRTHYTASMAKALVAGLSLGVAITDGRIALDDRASKYIPQWDHPQKARITLRQLGSHTSGLEDAEADDLPHEKLTGWKGTFWKRLDPPQDPFTTSRDMTPVLAEPGATFQYSNPGIAMLTYAVTASLRDATSRDIRTLLRDRIMKPIGVADEHWSVGYGRTYTVDGLPLVPSWGGGNYTARAVARVGRLLLRHGDWDGTPLLSANAIRHITTDAGTPGHGGIGWWSNNDGRYPALPRDTFWGSGAGHQVLVVIPSRNLIAVRNGESFGGSLEHHDALNAVLFEPLLKTIEAVATPDDRLPYPRSSVISGIEWAPAATIVRQAEGSDNFPLTWGDDDHLYTAYGDGHGFAPRVPEKLSLGFARILGSPPSVSGENIRSATGEQKGDGARGRKASGMLMVDGVLYIWARNAGNSQLAWSTDRGRTWTWSDWKLTTSFGCPTFLNFGKNYAGARDTYVYIYSHDSDSAYEVADRMVLARVPKDKIKRHESYEYFSNLNPDGRTVWTKDIRQRGAVFENRGRCYRSSVSYNPALKRYLWCQIGPNKDSRFAGGFAIYDAPEPWGPWTTVYATDAWDVGPGETNSFPTKWMSADGKTLHLVFSGDDSFSVRQAVVTLRNSGKE